MAVATEDIQLTEGELAAYEAALAEADLREYVRQAWAVVEPGTPYRHNWHIDAISDHLQAVSEGQIRRLIINIPPRCMKSLQVAVFWPTWHWGPHGKPSCRWLFSSYALTLSIRDSLKCRRLIQSDWYQRRWGDRFTLTSDQNAKVRYDNDQMGYRLATSVTGALTGEGGDIIVIDDPHNAIEGESEAIRESTVLWWDEAMSTRLNDPKTGAYVIVMQRIHEEDLVGHILSREHGWDHLCLPAEYESDHPHPTRTTLGFTDPRAAEGDGALLWPERLGREEIDELKARLGPYAAAGQLQQRPSPAEGGMFKREYIRYFKTAEDWYECLDTGRRVPKQDCWRFETVDTAFTEKTTSDYTVRMVWDVERVQKSDGEYVGGAMFLVDVWRERLETPKVEAQLKADIIRWKPIFVGMEAVSDGATIYQRFKNDGLPVRRIKYGSTWRIPDKVTKATLAEVWMSQGKVYFEADAPYVSALEHELLTFPNGAHDDQVDALAMACHFANNRDLWVKAKPERFAKDTLGDIAGHNKQFKPKVKDPFAR